MKEKAFIIHVRGNKERKQHIENELASTPFEYELIEGGNIEDLEKDTLAKYFTGDMLKPAPNTSCAFKHLLAYEMIVKNQLPYASIIEDDIVFTSKFNSIFHQATAEIEREKLNTFVISYEESLHLFIRRSEEQKGRFLYKKNKSRFAGFYMVDFEAAKLMLAQAQQNKIGCPIDWWHNELINKGLLNVYWCHPTISRQQSHNGRFASLIDDTPHGLLRIITYNLKIFYKRIRQAIL
jgi:glycosyl transferase family 25